MKKDKNTFRQTAVVAAMMMSMTVYGQADTLSKDTALWYNQTQQLDEVVIKSSLPKTRAKGNAMRTTVAGTILEKAGTVSDALARIPSLEADYDGAVKVTGRGDAEVYINGRRVQDTKELTRLRSDQVQHVDVVQNPGARYAASTKAVVRITLKKTQGEGLSFQNSMQYMYQYGGTLNDNFVANYRTRGLDITASLWAGRYGHNRSLQKNILTYYAGSDFIEGVSEQDTKITWKGWAPQLQINYMADENHSFGAFYKYDRQPTKDHSGWLNTDNYENGLFTERSESDIWTDESSRKYIFNVYYNGKVGQLGIDLNVDGLFDDTKAPNETKETNTDAEGLVTRRTIKSNTDNGNNFWASKLILNYPVWKGNLSLGGEYSYNHRTDAYDFSASETVPVKAIDTEINEKSASAFVEYGRQFGKLFAQVGLRYEHLKTNYYNFGTREDEVCRDYGDWFPTASLSMPLGNVQLSLSYRRDIERPNYSNLSSYTVYINRYTYQSGNPYLKPMYIHSLVLNCAYKWMNMMVNYSRINDAPTMSTESYPGYDDPLVSLIRPINTRDDYNQLLLHVALRPVIGCWHPYWSAYVIFRDYKSPCADGSTITLNHPYASFAWQNDIELPRHWRLSLMAQWLPKGDTNNFRITRSVFNSFIGVQRDISLRSLGSLTTDLRCYDPFETAKNEGIIFGVRELTMKNPARRTFMLNLTWKFNEARSKYRGSGAGEKQKARM